MAVKSVLLKLSSEAHAQIQEAAKVHKRSMQSVLVTLIEAWLAAGAPDPVTFLGGQLEGTGESAQKNAVDTGARTAIEALTRTLRDIQQHVLGIDETPSPIDPWSQKVLSELKDIEYRPNPQRTDGYRIRRRRPGKPSDLEQQSAKELE